MSIDLRFLSNRNDVLSKEHLVYIGDSAPLSYLQTIRQLVGTVVGSSAFTIDPQRHKILEASVSIPPPHQHTCTLPDREVAFFLVESFFANVGQHSRRQIWLNIFSNI